MSDWQIRTAVIHGVNVGLGGGGNTPWPWDALGGSQPDGADPFSRVKPAGGAGKTTAAAAAPDPADVLDQLKREAEVALRDPNYVSAYANANATSTARIPAEGDPKPLQTLAQEANHADSLMDMLDTADHIDSLIGSRESLDEHELFATPAAPDVLWQFTGDIAPTRRRDVTAQLTRREHHLVSMDSAFRPAPALKPDPDHDA
ncbi:conserved hypothetical protein [Cupriavidus taiwanensis]|uniref:TagK domain-containing protein n=1 Tax=Cupriavidus taiwanensis TaxID=164546 RepID=UPI000E133961|nr:TagK domain-containing protein [Cupriavidus taiwanensis]SPA29043.1 conserved hypothetical protein [Cupriavidus taiwanensis]